MIISISKIIEFFGFAVQAIVKSLLWVKKSILGKFHSIFWVFHRNKINFTDDTVELSDLEWEVDWKRIKIGKQSVFAPIFKIKLKQDTNYFLTYVGYTDTISNGLNKLSYIDKQIWTF
jgi:hypothetical protein